MNIDWQDKHHSELTARELYDLLALRSAVFVVEQQCAYQDVDGKDLQAENRHLLGIADGQLVAYARLLSPEDKSSPGKNRAGDCVRSGAWCAAGQPSDGEGDQPLSAALAGSQSVSLRSGASGKVLRAVWFCGGRGELPGRWYSAY